MFVVVTEDALSESVAGKLVREMGVNPAEIRYAGRRGFGYLRANVRKYMEAAGQCPVLMLTDLDARPCASGLVADWVNDNTAPKAFMLRVAVRETEAWLIADRDGFSDYVGISKAKLPKETDLIADPKRYLLELARISKKKKIREGLLPPAKSSAVQGFEYNTLLCKFVDEHWSSESAAANNLSLGRAIARLKTVSI